MFVNYKEHLAEESNREFLLYFLHFSSGGCEIQIAASDSPINVFLILLAYYDYEMLFVSILKYTKYGHDFVLVVAALENV